MAIANDAELRTAVANASALVQDIQNHCGRTLRDDSKIKFPRGLIGTADSYRARCPGYLDAETVSSCAYGFMHLDVMWWLVSRTDLMLVGRQMALKSAIVSLGTILEAILNIPGLPKNKWLSVKSSAGVRKRVDEVVKQGWISADPRPFVLTLLPQYVARELGKALPLRIGEITKYAQDHADALKAMARFERERGPHEPHPRLAEKPADPFAPANRCRRNLATLAGFY